MSIRQARLAVHKFDGDRAEKPFMNKTMSQAALRGLLGAVVLALAVGPMAVVAATSADTASTAAKRSSGTTPTKKDKKSSAPQSQLVDINTASKAQLKKLPDIGDAEADKIIAARPYLSKADLITKGVLSTGTYYSVKAKIIAAQPAQPKSGKSASGMKK